MPTDVVVAPPKLIGSTTVALCLGVTLDHLWHLVRGGDARVMPGYLGKINGRHVWNAHELFSSMYTSPAALWEEIERVETGGRIDTPCFCGRPVQFLGLCRWHVAQLMTTFERATHSPVVVWQLLAMCRWVVERNAHLEPRAGWDPWSGECMTPGCQNRTDAVPDRVSPLCIRCARKLWNRNH